MSDRPSATLCVIARNEEEAIPSCISSARHLVHEIIVVDTGSADRTKEVALECGAQVFSFCWKQDFAAARNYALELATGDWILVLDADEVLGWVEADEFARLLADPNVEGYFVQIRNYLDGGRGVAEDQVVRLFRNRPGYRFEGASTNRLPLPSCAPTRAADSRGPIW
ncbi:MAG: glycosyltransferase family 2 protein [Desulfotomaculales bacterium]